jgi:SAM-dependent methyltransferase
MTRVARRYDTIGRSYTSTRQPDPRIARQITAALGDARRIVNVGAGTGSYEPNDRFVVAVDPSLTMLQLRAPNAAPALLGGAEVLPFADDAFDVALASLTVHHWTDRDRGLREMRRVAPRQVIFFFEPSYASALWVVTEYFPEILDLGSERAAPGLEQLAASLDVERVEVVAVPADCQDGFGGCYWNRPEAYLDPVVQAGMSSFAQLDPDIVRRGMQRLQRDLDRGAWDERHGALRDLEEIDLGYRLLVTHDHHLS